MIRNIGRESDNPCQSDRLIAKAVQLQILQKKQGGSLDFDDLHIIEMELAEHGIHFDSVNERTVEKYQAAASRRGVLFTLSGKMQYRDRTGD